MARWPLVGSGGGFDYVQDAAPSNPVEGEEWYDTLNAEAKVYDGASWHGMTVGDFTELSGLLANTQIPDSEITALKLAFDPATQTELNNHAGSANAHHAPPTSTLTGGGSYRRMNVRTNGHTGVGGYVNEYRLDFSSFNIDVTVTLYTDEGTKSTTHTPSSSGTKTYTINAAHVGGISISGQTSYLNWADVNVQRLAGHSHSI